MKKIFVFVALALLVSSCSIDSGLSTPKIYNHAIADDTGLPSLLLVGDSRVQDFPDGLLDQFFDVTNIGVGGTTSYYSAYAIQNQTRRYDYIIISVGINDMANGATLQDTVSNLGACVAQAKKKSSNVFLTTIPGINPCQTFPFAVAHVYSFRAAQVNSFVPTIATNYSVEWVPINFALNYGIYLDAQYADSTGIHYNAAGYDILAAMYLNALAP